MKFWPILLSLVFAGTANAAVTLAGDMVDVGMYRTIDDGYGVGRVVGYGLDASFIVQEGASDKKQYSGAFTIDVDGASFLIDFIDAHFGWQPGTVLRLEDLDFSNGATLRSLLVDTNLMGQGVRTGIDFVEIDLGNVKVGEHAYFKGTFVPAVETVPEPSSVALMALALAGVAGATRRVRREQ